MSERGDVASMQNDVVDHSTEKGWYLYGVSRSADIPNARALDRAGDTLTTVESGDLVGIVCEVSLAEYAEDALAARLQDYDWLIQAAQAHQRVVAGIHEIAAVLPAKFGTIYSTDRAVRDALSEASDRLLASLDAIGGCDEWALHLFGHPETMRSHAISADHELSQMLSDLETASPGRAYMLRQRVEARTDAAVDKFQQLLVQHTIGELWHLVRDYQIDAPNKELRKETGEFEIARATVLVHRELAEEFLAMADAVSAENLGVWVEFTGPWPPYSFARVGDED